jgi:hypothetical protein
MHNLSMFVDIDNQLEGLPTIYRIFTLMRTMYSIARRLRSGAADEARGESFRPSSLHSHPSAFIKVAGSGAQSPD